MQSGAVILQLTGCNSLASSHTNATVEEVVLRSEVSSLVVPVGEIPPLHLALVGSVQPQRRH